MPTMTAASKALRWHSLRRYGIGARGISCFKLERFHVCHVSICTLTWAPPGSMPGTRTLENPWLDAFRPPSKTPCGCPAEVRWGPHPEV